MHVSVLSAGDVKLQKYVAEQGPIVEDVFNGHSSMRYTDLTTTFMRVTLKSEITAEKRIAEWEKKGPIKKEFAGLYVRGT